MIKLSGSFGLSALLLLSAQSMAVASEQPGLATSDIDLAVVSLAEEAAPIEAEASALGTGAAIAQADLVDAVVPGEFSSTLSFTSNYVFRGISQSNNNPAIQGSFDYSLGLSDVASVYAGVFGSNVDFSDGDEATIEIDLYAGAGYQVSDELYADFTAFYYLYPGADSSLNYDYAEFVANAGYDLDAATLGATVAYAPDNFGSTGSAFYTEGRVDVPLPQGVMLNAALGYQTIEDNTAFGTPDHLNWSVGVGYSIAGFDLGLKYTDTNLSTSECFGGTDLCDGRAVFSASRTF